MSSEVAYFGEKGSFASLVAQRRYSNASLVSIPTAAEVIEARADASKPHMWTLMQPLRGLKNWKAEK